MKTFMKTMTCPKPDVSSVSLRLVTFHVVPTNERVPFPASPGRPTALSGATSHLRVIRTLILTPCKRCVSILSLSFSSICFYNYLFILHRKTKLISRMKIMASFTPPKTFNLAFLRALTRPPPRSSERPLPLPLVPFYLRREVHLTVFDFRRFDLFTVAPDKLENFTFLPPGEFSKRITPRRASN